MPNVMMTTICNLKCPYCFGKEKISRPNAPKNMGTADIEKEIPIQNIRIITDIFKKWGIARINLLGGEPTLHSHFREVIDFLQLNRFKITIFTNGIIQKDVVAFLAGKKGITYILNHNDPEFYSLHSSLDDLFLINYFLSRCGKDISLGFNIYERDFKADFLVEKIKKFNLKRIIRIGFANPICSIGSPPENEFLSLEDYRVIIPKLIEFSRICDREDIVLSLDCGLPLCALTKEEYGALYYNWGDLSRPVCHPAIDIGIDLRVWRCFVTSGMYNERKITEFGSLREIQDYFNKRYQKFQMIGGMDRCFNCKYMKRNQCQGGCIAHTINRFQRASKSCLDPMGSFS